VRCFPSPLFHIHFPVLPPPSRTPHIFILPINLPTRMQWIVALALFTVYHTKTLRDMDHMLRFWLGTTLRSSVPRVPIGRLRVSPTSSLQTHAILGARTCGMHTPASTPIIHVPPAALRPPSISSASSTAPLDVRTQVPRTPPASPITPLLAPTPSTPRRAPTVLYASSSTHRALCLV
jgi:hypothetical protein